jgi:hypothetical protein
VLAEPSEHELGVAAFEGSFAFHGEYPDVQYRLARTLDGLDCPTDTDQLAQASEVI